MASECFDRSASDYDILYSVKPLIIFKATLNLTYKNRVLINEYQRDSS